MQIDISVLIWTLINFILLMFLLNTLLFKPLLRFMADREKRLSEAEENREKREKALKERLNAYALAEAEEKKAAKARQEEALRASALLHQEEAEALNLRLKQERGEALEHQKTDQMEIAHAIRQGVPEALDIFNRKLKAGPVESSP